MFSVSVAETRGPPYHALSPSLLSRFRRHKGVPARQQRMRVSAASGYHILRIQLNGSQSDVAVVVALMRHSASPLRPAKKSRTAFASIACTTRLAGCPSDNIATPRQFKQLFTVKGSIALPFVLFSYIAPTLPSLHEYRWPHSELQYIDQVLLGLTLFSSKVQTVGIRAGPSPHPAPLSTRATCSV